MPIVWGAWVTKSNLSRITYKATSCASPTCLNTAILINLKIAVASCELNDARANFLIRVSDGHGSEAVRMHTRWLSLGLMKKVGPPPGESQ